MRVPQLIAVTWLALVCVLTPAHAEKRVVLVIGNDRYANLPANEQLQKAANDARAVGGALGSIGFEVIAGENLGRRALLVKLGELIQRVAPGDMAFFFFSGHGVAVDGVNYILPADVPDIVAGQETLLKGEAIGEQYLISELTARGVRVAVVILDACRTNPFSRPSGKGVSGEKGLASPPQVKGVFSLYAASNGQVARDRLYDGDPSPNSVFTRVLVPALTRPGLDLTALAFDVRQEVARIAQTAGYVQEPAYYDGTIGGRVYLAGAPPLADAERTWAVIQNTTSIAILDDFLRQFGNAPIYGAMARARREELAKPAAGAQAAAVAPPVTPAAALPAPGPEPAAGPQAAAVAPPPVTPAAALPAPGPEPAAGPQMPAQGEIALMRSGAELMASGNVAGARLMYAHAAKAGGAAAAFALAETYDPLALAKRGMQAPAQRQIPDVGLARTWYAKAKDLGSTEAAERLERLARMLDATTPPTVAAAPAVAPMSIAMPSLDGDKINAMLVRAHVLLAMGDIAAARVVLRRAAANDDPRAALALGGTYDPATQKKLGLTAFAADPGEARTWYNKAAALGSADASLRLEQLPNR